TPPLYELRIPWPENLMASRSSELVPVVDQLAVMDQVAEAKVIPPGSLGLLAMPLEAIAVRPEQAWNCSTISCLTPAKIPLASNVPPDGWMKLIATIWLGGTAVMLMLMCRRICRFQHLLGDARPASEDVQDWVAELASGLGLRRVPGLWWI